MQKVKRVLHLVFSLIFLFMTASALATEVLENSKIKVEFNQTGLISLFDKQVKQALTLSSDQWAVTIDDNQIQSQNVSSADWMKESGRMRYVFTEGEYEIEVIYELKPGWRFISKQLFITSKNKDEYIVNSVTVIQGHLKNSPEEIYVADLGEKSKKSKGPGEFRLGCYVPGAKSIFCVAI